MKDSSRKPAEETSLIINTSSTTNSCHRSWASTSAPTKATTPKPTPQPPTNTLPSPAVITTPDSLQSIKPTISTCHTTRWDTSISMLILNRPRVIYPDAGLLRLYSDWLGAPVRNRTLIITGELEIAMRMKSIWLPWITGDQRITELLITTVCVPVTVSPKKETSKK